MFKAAQTKGLPGIMPGIGNSLKSAMLFRTRADMSLCIGIRLNAIKKQEFHRVKRSRYNRINLIKRCKLWLATVEGLQLLNSPAIG